jgi:signal peptidase I
MKTEKKIQKRLINYFLILALLILCVSYFIDFYQIPSDSMNNTLQKGDVTAIIKFKKSLHKIKKNDIIVFHFPEGDSVLTKQPRSNYYVVKEFHNIDSVNHISGTYGDLIYRDLSERSVHIKRCVATPNDTLFLNNGNIHINGKVLNTTLSQTGKKNKSSLSKKVNNNNSKKKYYWFFPHSRDYKWNLINFGPIIVPGINSKVSLNSKNINLYRRIIEVYENNKLKISDGNIFINNKLVRHYTFKKNYYFVFGDNRLASYDSRHWGFVPEDHVVGRAFLIVYSKNKSQEERKFIKL